MIFFDNLSYSTTEFFLGFDFDMVIWNIDPWLTILGWADIVNLLVKSDYCLNADHQLLLAGSVDLSFPNDTLEDLDLVHDDHLILKFLDLIIYTGHLHFHYMFLHHLFGGHSHFKHLLH